MPSQLVTLTAVSGGIDVEQMITPDACDPLSVGAEGCPPETIMSFRNSCSSVGGSESRFQRRVVKSSIPQLNKRAPPASKAADATLPPCALKKRFCSVSHRKQADLPIVAGRGEGFSIWGESDGERRRQYAPQRFEAHAVFLH